MKNSMQGSPAGVAEVEVPELMPASTEVNSVEAPRPRTRPPQTQFAMKALGLAERFAQLCGNEALAAGAVNYRLEMSAPDGPSTGGGKQAVQHIKLVPDQGTTIVMGQANQVEGRGEVRSYDCLVQLHAQRFKGQPLPFERAAYGQLFEKVRVFLTAFQLNVTVLDAPALPAPTSGSRRSAGSRGADTIARVVTAAAGLTLMVVLFLLFRR